LPSLCSCGSIRKSRGSAVSGRRVSSAVWRSACPPGDTGSPGPGRIPPRDCVAERGGGLGPGDLSSAGFVLVRGGRRIPWQLHVARTPASVADPGRGWFDRWRHWSSFSRCLRSRRSHHDTSPCMPRRRGRIASSPFICCSFSFSCSARPARLCPPWRSSPSCSAPTRYRGSRGGSASPPLS